MRSASDTSRAHSGRWWYILGAVLVLIGIGTALYQLWPDIAYQAGLVATDYPYPSKFAEESGSPVDSDSLPMGTRIVIPTIGVDVQIYEGDSQQGLRDGVYLHSETSIPGKGGNAAIAGHRNRRKFALLYRLEPGDPVVVYWNGTELDYRVTRVFGVGAEDTRILDDSPRERLTLYTCQPRFLGNKRTVVYAEPIASETTSSATP